MAKKRSRVGDSQIFGNIGVVNQYNSPELQRDPTFPANVPNRYHQSIFSVSSPLILHEAELSGHVCFLDNCYQCQKKLDLSQNTYMYRDFAFCTLECRDAKIAIDKAVKQSRGRRYCSRGMNTR